jgi:hypothetical protein
MVPCVIFLITTKAEVVFVPCTTWFSIASSGVVAKYNYISNQYIKTRYTACNVHPACGAKVGSLPSLPILDTKDRSNSPC